MYKNFLESGVNVNLHYIPIYLQPFYKSMGFEKGYCPESEKYFQETISLPMFPTLKIEEQNKIIKIIKSHFE